MLPYFPARAQAEADKSDVVVTGRRGSATSNVEPLVRLDAKTVERVGARSIADLLRAIEPLTRSLSGGEPVYLINGQRIGGMDELNTLPSEAIANVEILPEQAALKFGYPPSRKVVNFITKPRFAQVDGYVENATTTDGGAGSVDAHGYANRIANGRRLSLDGEYRHATPLLQSHRNIAPDPDYPFDAVGNITAADGGEIDPALSAAAGRPVLIAAVPADPAQRGAIVAYLPGANQPRSFDMGGYRTLISRSDKLAIRGVASGPLGRAVGGSLSFSAERGIDWSLQGLPIATIDVPAANPFSPFGRDVLLYRSLTEAGPLTLRTITTKLSLAGALHGNVGGWNWDLTGSLESNQLSNRGPDLVDTRAIDQAVRNGADPFAPIGPELLANRQLQRSGSINRRGEMKAVGNGTALRVPAGEVTLTATVEAERATAHTQERGLETEDLSIGRARIEGGVAFDIPLASRDLDILPFLGQLSLDLSANLRHVQGYGLLHDTSYGLLWSPTGSVQLSGTIKRTETAPNMGLRSAPVVQTANVPFYDALTGRSVLVTAIAGGNPDLPAERGSTRSANLTWRPLAKSDLNLQASYEDSTGHHQALQVTALTPATEAAFPDMFVRDSTGRLTTVLFQPVDFYRERKRTVSLQAAWNGPIGKALPKPAGPKQQPSDRINLYISLLVSPWLEDRLQLHPGLPSLNLLDGDTYDGSAARRQMFISSWSSLRYKGVGMNFHGEWLNGIDIKGGAPQSDLHFSSLLKIETDLFVDLGKALPHTASARKTIMFLQVENALNARQRVEDGTGATPNRYQPAYLDPLGRTIRLTIRRVF